MFGIVDQVVEAGHDPRRFAEDLLERLRDLIIIDAVPEAAGAILGEHPADELDRMRQQAAHFGAAQLSRAADIVNAGLTEMRGATAPRLQLELICARVLLPAAEDTERGVAARLDRLERRADIAVRPRRSPPRPPRHRPAVRRPRLPSRRRAAATPVATPPAATAPAATAEPAAEAPVRHRPSRRRPRTPTAEPVAVAALPRRPPCSRRPSRSRPRAGPSTW